MTNFELFQKVLGKARLRHTEAKKFLSKNFNKKIDPYINLIEAHMDIHNCVDVKSAFTLITELHKDPTDENQQKACRLMVALYEIRERIKNN